jgi:Na+-driven multidrug efflux pump
MLGTLAVVLTVTHAAERLGPSWSGAVTPFPVALAVLLVFAHAQQGAPLAIRLLHGFFPAMWGFGLFCLVIALAMVPLGPWLAFLLALIAQVTVHGVVLWRMMRGPAADRP